MRPRLYTGRLQLQMTSLVFFALVSATLATTDPSGHYLSVNVRPKLLTGAETRARRSILNVVASLFKPIFLTYSAPKYAGFKKLGTYKDALKDFRRLKPTDIREFTYGKEGRVGDHIITLKKLPRSGDRAGAEIDIVAEKEGKKVIIEYVKKYRF